MKYLIVVVFFIALQFRQGLFGKLESNETGAGQQRSARVHRVSEFPVNEEPYKQNPKNEETFKQGIPMGSQKIFQSFSERLQSSIPELNDLIQREVQLFKELPRDARLKNEISDISSSATSSKSMLKNIDHLNSNLLNSPEELDIYRQESQDDGKLIKLGSPFSQIESTNELELKTVKNVAQYLDNILMEIQNHINYVRNVFDKICRKHHSSTRTNTNMEKPTSTNQPKKVSML